MPRRRRGQRGEGTLVPHKEGWGHRGKPLVSPIKYTYSINCDFAPYLCF